jgi:hypothetical protein
MVPAGMIATYVVRDRVVAALVRLHHENHRTT